MTDFRRLGHFKPIARVSAMIQTVHMRAQTGLAMLLVLAVCVQPALSQDPSAEALPGSAGSSVGPSGDSITNQLTDIYELLDTVLRKVDLIELQLSSSSGANVAVLLDPGRPDKSGIVETELGNFLVRISAIEPYVSEGSPEENGFWLDLAIGNLSPAIYQGFKVAVTWSGRDFSGIRYTQQTFEEALQPSGWNHVSLVLPGTTVEEMVNLTVGLEVDSVSFGDASIASSPR